MLDNTDDGKLNWNRFLTKYGVDRQQNFCANPTDCIIGDYPTLAEADSLFDGISKAWTTVQVDDFNDFINGTGRGLSQDSIDQTASLIVRRFKALKVTELMLFFDRFKAGDHPKIYGVLTAGVIMDCLRDFWAKWLCPERNRLHELERRKQLGEQPSKLRNELIEQLQRPITASEYARRRGTTIAQLKQEATERGAIEREQVNRGEMSRMQAWALDWFHSPSLHLQIALRHNLTTQQVKWLAQQLWLDWKRRGVAWTTGDDFNRAMRHYFKMPD